MLLLRPEIRKKLLNSLLLAAIFAVTVWSVFRGENINEVIDFLVTADLKYIIPSILCVFLFIGGEAVSMYYLLRVLGYKIPIWHCWLHSFIGFFYSCITPSSSGGQPMQILSMRKDSVPAPVSTVVLAILAISYKLVLVIIGLAVMIVRPDAIIAHIYPVRGFIYVGLVLNIICIAVLMMLVFMPSTIKMIAKKIIMLISRIHTFRHPEKISASLERITGQYAGAANFYRRNGHVLFHVLVLTFLQRIALFAITWFTYRAFSMAAENPATIMTLQSMISVAADMVPLPGGMGASENLFIEVFRNIFGEDRVLPAMVISRGISFYAQVLISGAMTIAAVFLLKDKQNIIDT